MESPDLKSIQLFARLKPSLQTTEDLIQVNVPGSKSITNRILLIAALGKGTVRLSNFLKSADTSAMLGAMSKLQIATFEYDESSAESELIVRGNGGAATGTLKDNVLHVNNSGTAARFLTTLAVVMSGKYKQPIHVTGNEQIKKRPIDPLVDALLANGCDIQYEETVGTLPLCVQNLEGFAGGHIKLDARISSQYVSSILMCAPYANEPVTLELYGHIISRSYIDMTIALMKSFGIEVTQVGANVYRIPKGVYQNPPEFAIEPDASTATYPMAVAAVIGRAVTIPQLGTRSIQGDAGFARGILQKMGCEVTQTEHSTTVRGPPVGTLKSFGEVDMEPLTDTFLTAACLAAVVKDGVSTITGIANQRVKECNRISAMVSQLAKFGVRAEELEDGIKIFGQDYAKIECLGSVHCFDDHRVAMSFSVLGCLVPCFIRDRFCTKKTWPEWWDVLSNTIGLELCPIDIADAQAASSSSESNPKPENEPDEPPQPRLINQTVVLIGMRGVGKTTAGRAAAKLLSKRFVDMDEEFSKVHKMTANEYIKLYGWEAFRDLELHVLLGTANKYSRDCIIATGGGIVETEDARAMLGKINMDVDSFIVVHIRRNLQKIVQDPSFQTKIAYGEDVATVWGRRKPWYDRLSSKEFYVTDSGNCAGSGQEFAEIFQQMASFIQSSYGGPTISKFSQTTSPTLPIYSMRCDPFTAIEERLEEKWRYEVNKLSNLYKMLEFRFVIPEDRIRNEEEIKTRLEELAEHYFLLKRISNLPVGLTCVAAEASFQTSHASAFVDSLLQMATKWNVDLLCLDEQAKLHLSAAAKESIANSQLRVATLYHGPDLDTVLSKINYDIIENDAASTGIGRQQLVEEIIHVDNESAIAGRHLMPSTTVSADQLITKLKAINLRVVECNKMQPRNFYLFGSPISKSKSPLLHNTGFGAVELPYKYQRFEASEVESAGIESFLKDPAFGGASVTIPLKEKIGEFLDEITAAGVAIGAINTIYRNQVGKHVGDNTDYIGMLRVLEPAVRAMEVMEGEDRAKAKEVRGMIIGGGGTARAAIYTFLSIPRIKHITIVNRSVSKAQALIEEFQQKPTTRKDVTLEADSLESLNCVCFDDLHHPHFIISTIPADAQAGCKFSRQLFKQTSAVVEMVYGIKTPLLQAVEDFNAKSQSQSQVAVGVATGAQVLIEQGLRQFEIWTGLTLPFEEMRAAVEKAFESENQ